MDVRFKFSQCENLLFPSYFVVYFQLRSFIRGTVHQSFPDFTFLTGNWIGKLMKLKGEIDPEVAIDLSNKATLAFLQRHLGKSSEVHTSPAFKFCVLLQ